MLGQSNFSLFTFRRTRGRFEFKQPRASAYAYPVVEMGEYAGKLPRKIISVHCLENESNEQKGCNAGGAENFPDLPRRIESDGECSDGGESPEKRLVELEVMPVCEFARSQSKESV